jgi:hypothetical protein
MIPHTSAMFVPCVSGAFLGGPRGGGGGACPPLVTHNVRGSASKSFFGWFLLFLVDFSIFSGFVN